MPEKWAIAALGFPEVSRAPGPKGKMERNGLQIAAAATEGTPIATWNDHSMQNRCHERRNALAMPSAVHAAVYADRNGCRGIPRKQSGRGQSEPKSQFAPRLP